MMLAMIHHFALGFVAGAWFAIVTSFICAVCFLAKKD
jgi:hypothetical protein